MSGLLRNLLTLFSAWLSPARPDPWSLVSSCFWISPLDCGTSVLKSDRYLQLSEAAQLDFLVKTRLLGPLLRGGVRFVNASQLIRFARPVGMFKRVQIQTGIVYADEKCAYFRHVLLVGQERHAEVLVKMKFKKGTVTVCPRELLGPCLAARPAYLQAWDEVLDALQQP